MGKLVQEYIDTQVSIIKKLYGQTIDALGIGGSFGTKTSDRYSDIEKKRSIIFI